MSKKAKKTKQKAIPYGVMVLGGTIVVAILALALYVLIEQFDLLPLYEENDSISNYLGLIGVSFSVTFITTSLLGGLSDKSEKIYWISYPEHYLINKSLNFNVLSTIGFICLAIQVVMMFLKGRYEAIREAIFLSAFIIGIIAIVILTFKFTAVFFSRKKLLLKVQAEFKDMIETPEREEELKEAVVGIFNNTLEVTSVEASNLERIRENVTLLLDYEENETCSFWLTKLITEIGRINISVLVQLVTLIENKKFIKLLNMVGNDVNGSSEFAEVLHIAYSLQLVQLIEQNKALAEEDLSVETVGREVNIILTKIKTDNIANCIFLLEQLLKLPYEWLRSNFCYHTVITKWEDILVQFAKSVKEKDVNAYQKFQKPMFEFLTKHPSHYFERILDIVGEIGYYQEALGKELNNRTAKCIDKLSTEELSFMIDVIEAETQKQTFMVWMANQMAEKRLSEKMWMVSKPSGNGTIYYANIWIDYIIRELHVKEERVSEKYKLYRAKGQENILYIDNIPLREYIDYVEKIIKLLSRVKEYERRSSLEKFLGAVISRVSIGEQNSFKYTTEVITDDGWSELEKVEQIINCYTIVFNALVKEGKTGLEDLCKVLTIPQLGANYIKNYFNQEEEKKQKRSEMLFFLGRVNRFVRDENLSKEEIQACAGIMARVLSNPCIGPVYTEAAENPDEINESLEYIQSNKVASEVVGLFLEQLDLDEMSNNDLAEIYTMVGNYESIEDFERAAFYEEVAKEYEKALQALKDSLDL